MAKAGRNSSVELLRIISILFVIILHLNGAFVDFKDEGGVITFYNFGQQLIEASTLCCVNCFLIISGYYGIKMNVDKIWALYVQLVYLYISLYLTNSIITKDFNIGSLLGCFAPFSRGNYFVTGYILLMLFSPFLNAFIEIKREKTLKYAAILLFAEFWLDCVRGGGKTAGFAEGYTVLHFIVIYIFSRTVFYYKEVLFKVNKYYYLLGYIAFSLIILLQWKLGIQWTWAYTNPIVIFSAMSLFLFFACIEFRNHIINLLASSSLAVFIFHTTKPIVTFLIEKDKIMLAQSTYPAYLLWLFITAIAIFGVGFLYNQFFCTIVCKPQTWILEKIKSKLLK